MTMNQLCLQIMAAGHGHKDRFYDPTKKSEVSKIKAFIKKKLAEGWILYGMKAGEKDMTKIADVSKIDDKNLDRFILAGHDQVSKKLLAQPITGG